MTESTPILKGAIRADLTASMKARNTLTTGTLRMVLAAIGTAEVAGDTAKELSDDEVLAVLAREVKKRKESAELFAGAGRGELAEKELAEAQIISGYLPEQLSDQELAGLVQLSVHEVVDAAGSPPTMKQMGQVIAAVQRRAGGRADGKRIAAAVRSALG